jgi:ankyrin repeat protein
MRSKRHWSEGRMECEFPTFSIHTYHDMVVTLTIPRFRWVACQIDTLKDCLDYRMLRRALETLPKTLDQTYARILERIPGEYSTQATTILNLLIWSNRKFEIYELVDAIAVDLVESPAFDPRNRMPVPREVLKLCSSLVAMSPDDRYVDVETVHLAHFSVKEYLVSSHVLGAFKSLLDETVARSYLARLCLRYLVSVSHFVSRNHPKLLLNSSMIMADFPFVKYSVYCWMVHAREVEDKDEHVFEMMLRFFLEERTALAVFVQAFDWQYADKSPFHYSKIGRGALYYAASGGLKRMVEYLLDDGANINADDNDALHVALKNRNFTTVQLLLERGAKINSRDGSALRTAVERGEDTYIQLLLDRGADTNAGHGKILLAALEERHETALQLLLDGGVDVNTRDGQPLRTASRLGYDTAVQLLLERGADPNAHYGSEPTALHEALGCGLDTLLIRLGRGDSRRTALESDQIKGYHRIARLLVDSGADTNFPGGAWFDTLRAGGWSVQIVQQILERNPFLPVAQLLSAMLDRDPHAEAIRSIMLLHLTPEGAAQHVDHEKGNLLHCAALCGWETIVQRCLDLDVDTHARDINGKTALHYASEMGRLVIVKMLIRAGSDTEALDNDGETPLRCAEHAEEDPKWIDRSEFKDPPSYPDVIKYLARYARPKASGSSTKSLRIDRR